MTLVFYQKFRRIQLVFQALGLAPFGSTTKQNIVLQVISVGILLVAALILASLFLVSSYVQPSGLMNVVSRLLLVAEIVTHIIVICQSYATRRQQNRIWRNLDEVRELLNGAGQSTSGAPGRRLLVKMWTMLGIVVGTMLIEAAFLWTFYPEYIVTYALQIAFPTLVNRVRCVQIVFYVDLLRELLGCVARRLRSMGGGGGGSNSRPKGSKWLLCPDKGEWWQGKMGQSVSKANRNSELRTLRAAYGKIWDTSCLINDCFGWTLLAIVTQYFIHLTTYGYWLFMIMAELIDVVQCIESLTDVLSVLFLLTALCQSCYASSQLVYSHFPSK